MHVPRLALVTAAALTLVGCGGSNTPDRTAGLPAAEILELSATATKELTAYRLAADVSVTATLAPGTLPALFQNPLAEGVVIRGEGPVNGADALFDFDLTLGTLPPFQANVTKVGGQLFAGLLGTDYTVVVPPEQVRAIVPSTLAGRLLGWVSEPTEVGRETVDGVRTVHLRGLIATDVALEDIVAVVGSLQGASVPAATLRQSRRQLADAITTRTVDLWIGTADLLPRRVTAALVASGTISALPQVRTIDLTVDARVLEPGTGVAITAPTAPQELDLSRLESLAGP